MLSSVLELVPFSLSPTHAVVTAVLGRNMILGFYILLYVRWTTIAAEVVQKSVFLTFLACPLVSLISWWLFSSPTTKSSETSFQQLMHCIECTRVPQLILITIPLSLATVFKSFSCIWGHMLRSSFCCIPRLVKWDMVTARPNPPLFLNDLLSQITWQFCWDV